MGTGFQASLLDPLDRPQVGPIGSGKLTAATALACAFICDDLGCGTCPACVRVRRMGASSRVRSMCSVAIAGPCRSTSQR